MKFKINGRTWEIIELNQEEMRDKIREFKYDGEPREGKYFGLTFFDRQCIYIDKYIHEEQKRQTLMHELVHCYIGTFSQSKEGYDEEEVCNISSNSHDIIHKIVEDYFKKKVK